MVFRQFFSITASLVTAAFAVIHIYKLVLEQDPYPANSLHEVSSFLILNPWFWCWTIIGWIAICYGVYCGVRCNPNVK